MNHVTQRIEPEGKILPSSEELIRFDTNGLLALLHDAVGHLVTPIDRLSKALPALEQVVNLLVEQQLLLREMLSIQRNVVLVRRRQGVAASPKLNHTTAAGRGLRGIPGSSGKSAIESGDRADRRRRLGHLECPTCHRDLDPETFGLSVQSAESVDAHIEALKSDRELMIKNRGSISANIRTATAVGAQIDLELRDAERALTTVSSAVGPLREQLAATAAELTAAERESDRLSDATAEIDSLQKSIDHWIADAKGVSSAIAATSDVEGKLNVFTEAFRKYLVALGHSEVNAQNSHLVVLDRDNYVPFMNGRRLRALGSASDQSRLVAAYSLALAAASQKAAGKHPGLLILDEPLQQNPDPEHRERFQEFLEREIAQQSKFQTLIFTSLYPDEIDMLRKKGAEVTTPAGSKFLTLVKPPQQVPPSKVTTPARTQA